MIVANSDLFYLLKKMSIFHFPSLRIAKGWWERRDMWCVNFTERQDRCDLWIYKPHEVWFASWSVQMFFFQFLKTSRFPLNLIHKKRYLKFSLLNLWPLKFCLKYLHDVWTFLKFEDETASAPSPPPSLCYPLNPLTLKSDQHVISPYHIRSISPLNQTLKSWE